MLAGQAQAAPNGIAETMIVVLRGATSESSASRRTYLPIRLIVSKGCKNAKDLVGGRIAVNGSEAT